MRRSHCSRSLNATSDSRIPSERVCDSIAAAKSARCRFEDTPEIPLHRIVRIQLRRDASLLQCVSLPWPKPSRSCAASKCAVCRFIIDRKRSRRVSQAASVNWTQFSQRFRPRGKRLRILGIPLRAVHPVRRVRVRTCSLTCFVLAATKSLLPTSNFAASSTRSTSSNASAVWMRAPHRCRLELRCTLGIIERQQRSAGQSENARSLEQQVRQSRIIGDFAIRASSALICGRNSCNRSNCGSHSFTSESVRVYFARLRHVGIGRVPFVQTQGKRIARDDTARCRIPCAAIAFVR